MFHLCRHPLTNSSTQPNYSTNIHIWETGMDTGVGHASLELKQDGKVIKYVSLRPKYPSLVNPLTLPIPTPGINLTSIEEDQDMEGREADRIFSFPLTEEQFEEMASEADKISEQISTKKRLYQLNPRISMLSFATLFTKPSASKALTECPITGLQSQTEIPDFSGLEEIQSSHCALTVADVLSAGQIKTHFHHVPWVISPSNLGDQLQTRVSR